MTAGATEQLVSTLARKWRVDVDLADGGSKPFSAVASTDTFTSTGHGLADGDTVRFATGQNPTGVTVDTDYFVRDAATNTFKISATDGGTALDLSADKTGTLTAGASWVQVRAINELTPGIDANLEDDADYDNDGWTSQTKTAQGWTLGMTLLRKVGFNSRAYDAGQERIRQAADAFGPDATVHVRWYDRDGGTEAYEGFGTVSWEPQGGGVTALDSANVTVTGQGARLSIDNPVAP